MCVCGERKINERGKKKREKCSKKKIMWKSIRFHTCMHVWIESKVLWHVLPCQQVAWWCHKLIYLFIDRARESKRFIRFCFCFFKSFCFHLLFLTFLSLSPLSMFAHTESYEDSSFSFFSFFYSLTLLFLFFSLLSHSYGVNYIKLDSYHSYESHTLR